MRGGGGRTFLWDMVASLVVEFEELKSKAAKANLVREQEKLVRTFNEAIRREAIRTQKEKVAKRAYFEQLKDIIETPNPPAKYQWSQVTWDVVKEHPSNLHAALEIELAER